MDGPAPPSQPAPARPGGGPPAPGATAPGATARAHRRRGLREWVVDIGLFTVAVLYGLAWAIALEEDPEVSDVALIREQTACVLACAALWLRRRWPVGLALGLIPLSSYATLADGAQFVALFTVAVHRPAKVAAPVGTAVVVAQALYFGLYLLLAGNPDAPDDDMLWIVGFTAITVLAVLGWGMMVRHRRQLVVSLRERAVRAEAEAQLRAEQAQMRAREQIAREMHDVLGHRLSLLSVQAGALEYRPDAPPEEVARAAAVIRGSAHQALQDLREVIGVLRAPVGELPQPTLADVRSLVAESVEAGTPVTLEEAVAGRAPDTVGRTAYRIVQEGLTNARRHAPGAAVRVVLRGAAGDGLEVEVRNGAAPAHGPGRPGSSAPSPDPVAAPAPTAGGGVGAGAGVGAPGGGQGLIGLAERVSLAGGRLTHGPDGEGGFRLAAWLPWPV
ncbi:signal transduction histidine kinase [Streptomonospora nanhaiensis]|uniref:histidine kinase n=1 Tax=Streptomonospora nanhaiensis TaxID=1323731 RepID=A0A853BRI1_9ACTN|nr:histidine kinase [Streptomonospora nanhaiensis]NYI97474.1 signal transduction histidine kinase [Streptomonospora nanhaiensis]